MYEVILELCTDARCSSAPEIRTAHLMISQLADGLDQFFINIDKARVFSLALVVDMLSAFTGDSLKNVGTSELQRNHHFRLKLNSIEFPEELIEINPSQKW